MYLIEFTWANNLQTHIDQKNTIGNSDSKDQPRESWTGQVKTEQLKFNLVDKSQNQISSQKWNQTIVTSKNEKIKFIFNFQRLVNNSIVEKWKMMMIWNGIMIKLARTTTQLRLLSNSKLKLNENGNGKEWVTDYKDDDLSVKLNLVQFFNDLKRFFFQWVRYDGDLNKYKMEIKGI